VDSTKPDQLQSVVTVSPGDPLLVAYGRMKLHDISQLPVMEEGKIIAIIDESDLLLAATADPARLRDPVRDVMSKRLETVPVGTPILRLLPMFDQGLVPVVIDGDEFVGLLTRIDLLNYLRRKLDLARE
jgi:cystathionine beta-synthase